jgi:uncharacterized small protein (DUF1192 family)
MVRRILKEEVMNNPTEDGTAKPAGIVIGEDLSLLSVDELEERVVACEQEIERIKADLVAKKSGLAAAQAIFQK